MSNVFEKNDKRQLYWLMDNYLSGKFTAKTFCTEFYYSYDLEIDTDVFSNSEEKLLSLLSTVSGCFSEFEEDHKLNRISGWFRSCYSTNSCKCIATRI